MLSPRADAAATQGTAARIAPADIAAVVVSPRPVTRGNALSRRSKDASSRVLGKHDGSRLITLPNGRKNHPIRSLRSGSTGRWESVTADFAWAAATRDSRRSRGLVARSRSPEEVGRRTTATMEAAARACATARSAPASCSSRPWRAPTRVPPRTSWSASPRRVGRAPRRTARVSLVTVAARKDGGLIVRDVEYTPVGAGVTVLERVNLRLPPTGLNLIVGRSGNGKSTLLSLVAGLAEPTGGVITFSDLDPGVHLSAARRLDRVGLVFQFPERHFLGKNMLQELTFRVAADERVLPRTKAAGAAAAGSARGGRDGGFPAGHPRALAEPGYKRRLALAIQLVRDPYVLCLDEPLAGLDWMARAEVTKLLANLAARKGGGGGVARRRGDCASCGSRLAHGAGGGDAPGAGARAGRGESLRGRSQRVLGVHVATIRSCVR